MARFLYSAAMSLDGFIARPGGDMFWLTDYLGPNPVVDELIPQVGALLVGGRTYGGDDPHRGQEGEGKAFGGDWDGPQVVLTHRAGDQPVVPGYSPLNSGARLANIAVMPSVRSFDARNAEFQAAT
jgi:riboflavin biosynthesis pyrimidine reductase